MNRSYRIRGTLIHLSERIQASSIDDYMYYFANYTCIFLFLGQRITMLSLSPRMLGLLVLTLVTFCSAKDNNNSSSSSSKPRVNKVSLLYLH